MAQRRSGARVQRHTRREQQRGHDGEHRPVLAPPERTGTFFEQLFDIDADAGDQSAAQRIRLIQPCAQPPAERARQQDHRKSAEEAAVHAPPCGLASRRIAECLRRTAGKQRHAEIAGHQPQRCRRREYAASQHRQRKQRRSGPHEPSFHAIFLLISAIRSSAQTCLWYRRAGRRPAAHPRPGEFRRRAALIPCSAARAPESYSPCSNAPI